MSSSEARERARRGAKLTNMGEQPSSVKNEKQPRKRERFDFGSAIAIGVSLGLVFGMLFDNPAMGIVVGLNLAVLANGYYLRRQGQPQATMALAISVGALVIMAVIWILSAVGTL